VTDYYQIARKWAHSIGLVDLGSTEGINIIAAAIEEAEMRAKLELTKDWERAIHSITQITVRNLEENAETYVVKDYSYYKAQLVILEVFRRIAEVDRLANTQE
jgi:hypothetical protein